MARVKVFFTVDVEIWTGGWDDVDGRFPEAFRRYVYGDTPFGQYALPMTLQILNDHGLKGVFFVEPIFSARFGLAPLAEVVGLIRDARQEVQLHVHAEWVNEAREPLLSWTPQRKMQHLSHFSQDDQTALIGWGRRRLEQAGSPAANAFRAGSFVFNRDTLQALERNEIYLDSSYNHRFSGEQAGVWRSSHAYDAPVAPFYVGKVLEAPVTMYRDRPGHLRPLQLTACSLEEMVAVLRNAADNGHSTVVIVSHGFELLDRRDFSRDDIVVRRFRGLCEFLERNNDRFETCGLFDTTLAPVAVQPPPVKSTLRGLAVRYVEQARRRL